MSEQAANEQTRRMHLCSQAEYDPVAHSDTNNTLTSRPSVHHHRDTASQHRILCVGDMWGSRANSKSTSTKYHNLWSAVLSQPSSDWRTSDVQSTVQRWTNQPIQPYCMRLSRRYGHCHHFSNLEFSRPSSPTHSLTPLHDRIQNLF